MAYVAVLEEPHKVISTITIRIYLLELLSIQK